MALNIQRRSIVIDDIPVNPSTFRDYDIRGVADIDPFEPNVKREIDMTSRQSWLVGKAYGTWLKRVHNGQNIVVGRDNRRTSLDLATGFITGVLSTGCNVTDIGLAFTPLVYFASGRPGYDGGLMITGSHNPMWSNGLKLVKGGYQTLVGEEIQTLFEIIISEDFEVGKGIYETENILNVYKDALKTRTQNAMRPLKVVVDTGNATAGLVAPQLLSELGYEVIAINDQLIYPFPNGAPDPEQPDKVRELGEQVVRLGADVGIAYDGDADRVGIIDQSGYKVESDIVLLLLARQVIAENPGAEILFDVKCTDVLIDDISQRGGEPLMTKTGHSNVKQKMKGERTAGKLALLGGELSGHMFFADRFFGFDDGIYASCRFLEYLSAQEGSVSDQLRDLPDLLTTRELALPCPDENKADVVSELYQRFVEKGFDVIDIDGVRIRFEKNKWALVRMSNTQPKLTARFQAKTIEDLKEIVSLMRLELEKFPYVVFEDLDKGLAEVINS